MYAMRANDMLYHAKSPLIIHKGQLSKTRDGYFFEPVDYVPPIDLTELEKLRL